MLAEWREEMAKGNKEIDEQRQELLRRVEAQLRAVTSLRGSEEIHRTIRFLMGYVTKHFRMEENLQLGCSFPGYLAHMTQHEVFVRQVRRLESPAF
jgi:hemerythrin-like metal-binding protein